jgi:hypothetical protein
MVIFNSYVKLPEGILKDISILKDMGVSENRENP